MSKKKKDLVGAGGGGGSSRTPTRTPDTLISQDYFEMVLGLSEGPIKGLAPGVHSPLENFYVGTTPLANAADGKANFPDFAFTHYKGYDNDPAVQFNLGGQSSNIQVGVRLSQQVPVVRQTSAVLRGSINRLEFRIQFNQLVHQTDKGDTLEADAVFKIEYKPSTSATWSMYQAPQSSIRGKTTSGAVKDFIVDVPLLTNDDWDMRVTKISSDNFGEIGTIVEMTWESVQPMSMAPKKFEDVALIHIYARASNQFSSIPDFAGVYDGMLVSVPTNYNPETRTYDESTPWNGAFKQAFTNNPAWILYEMCMNQRWGLPRYYLQVTANRYEFYTAAKWCDEQVLIPSTGQYQPRFTFNEVFQDAKNGVEALQYIAGSFNSVILDDGTGTIVLRTDQPRTPKQIFTPENVANGEFSYSFTDITTRHNDVTAVFINPDLDWTEDRRTATIDNTQEIASNGRIPTEFVAVGCTNVHEAVRRANYQYITATTEKATVAFTTSRFGMFTEPLETIYVADPLTGWGKPGRIKSVAPGKIFLRDPIYFPTIAAKTIRVQTFEGLRSLVILPAFAGANYSLNIQSGTLPTDLPQNTVFTIEDNVEMGLAKPFKVLSIEEIDGSPDAFKITAIEVNVNKYPDADIGAISESIKYSYQTPGEPILPPSLKIESGRAHVQTATDGTLIHRAFVSWTRPFQAYTDYYQLDYKEAGASEWTTLSPIYGDSIYAEPLKDNTRYHFRLFAVTPLGKRSNKFLEVLDYLIVGKVGVLENVSGLAVQMVEAGWQFTWNVPTFPDYDVTELRFGLPVQEWETLAPFAITKHDRLQFGFLSASTYRMYAKYRDTSKNYSDSANYVEWEVLAPMSPVLTGYTIFNAPLIEWENAQTTQPIRLYRVKKGNSYATAELLGTTQDLRWQYNELESGLFRYWVEAEDMGGNISQPSSVQVLVLPTIEGAIDDLQEGLLDSIADILNINSGIRDDLLGEAIQRGTAIEILQNIVTEGDEALAQQIEILTARAVGYIRGNLVLNGGFEDDLANWSGDTDGWLTMDAVVGRIARDTSAIPAGKIRSKKFVAGPTKYYTLAADTELAGPTGTSRIGIEFLNAADAVIGTARGDAHGPHEFLNESARRIEWSFETQAPALTAAARFTYEWESLDPSGYVGLRMVKVEQGRMPATPYSSEASDIGSVAAIRTEATARATAISAEAALRETLAVRVNGVESAIETEAVVRADETGRLMARWGINMTVGNKVSGVVMNNNGVSTDFVILTDRFAVARETDTPGQYTFPFVVGIVDGVSAVGINGNLFVDGSIVGRSIAADTIEGTKMRAKTLTADQIKAGAIDASLLNVGRGANLIPNSTLMDAYQASTGQIPTGWSVYNTAGSTDTLKADSHPDWFPPNQTGHVVRQSSGSSGTDVTLVYCDIPIVGGQDYEFSFYCGAHRCIVKPYIEVYNGAGVAVAGTITRQYRENNNETAYQAGKQLSTFKRVGAIYTLPAAASWVRIAMRKDSSLPGQTSSYSFWCNPLFAEATPNQQVFSPYSLGGLGVRITPQGITTPSLSALSATIGTLRTSTSGQRSEIDDNGHRVYDWNNVMRTRTGIW